MIELLILILTNALKVFAVIVVGLIIAGVIAETINGVE